MSRPRQLYPALGVLLGAAAVAAGTLIRSPGEAEVDQTARATLEGAAPDAAAALRREIAIPVTGAKVTFGTLILRVTASGEAEAWRRTIVTPQVSGRVVTLPAR